MRSIVTIDNQPDASHLAVWVTSRTGETSADHVNAVVLDTQNSTETLAAVHSLTRRSAVLLTPDSDASSLPVTGTHVTLDDLNHIAAATEAMQVDIIKAVRDFNRAHKGSNLKVPEFSPLPHFVLPPEDNPQSRALANANHLARLWSAWLKTDVERARRTTHPKTGQTSWVMPETLNSPVVNELPAEFASLLHVQKEI